MYSTDDDLFNPRRTQKKWQRPTQSHSKAPVVAFAKSDDSSDDLATERDPLWRKQRQRGFRHCLRQGDDRNTKRLTKEKSRPRSASSSDFELDGGSALLWRSRAAAKRVEAQKSDPLKSVKKFDASSSDELCDFLKSRVNKHRLLERHSRQSHPQIQHQGREEEKHPHEASVISRRDRCSCNFKLELEEKSLNSTVKKMDEKFRQQS